MCIACRTYGKRLIITPLNRAELIVWHLVGGNMKAFRFIHRWFFK